MQNEKIFIYQLLPRLFGNSNAANKFNGTIEENGSGKFNDVTENVLLQLKEWGYTHVWYIGVIAHASATDYTAFGIPKQFPEIVKGRAGSPYAIRDYFDVDPDLAVEVSQRMTEFEALVERTHGVGLKVIIDNVPNHVARNYQSVAKPAGTYDFGEGDDTSVRFSPTNNFYYLPGQPLKLDFVDPPQNNGEYSEFPARVTGNDCYTNCPTNNDWYETVKLNYGVNGFEGGARHFDPIPDTWEKMKDVFLFWLDKGVDGFRCDMAEMVPLEFWSWVIPKVKARNPETIFVAEIYNPEMYRDFLYRGGFDYLYDKVGLYDTVREVACGHRPSSDISFTLNNVGDIQERMLTFLENHDEQRVASDYFLGDGNLAKAAMIVTACVHTNPVMIYAGQELGERGMDEEGFSGKDGRTTIFDYWSPVTLRKWNNNGRWDDKELSNGSIALREFYCNLIGICRKEKALTAGLYYDLMPPNYENHAFDSTSLFAFLRGKDADLLLVVTNFSRSEKTASIIIPDHAFDFFGIRGRENVNVLLTPLLKKEDNSLSFTDRQDITVSVPATSGEIYRISLR